MPMYKVRGTCSLMSHQKAVVELHAESVEQALAKARELDERGRLPWEDDSWDNGEPSAFEAEIIEPAEFIAPPPPCSPHLQAALQAADRIDYLVRDFSDHDSLDPIKETIAVLREALKGVELSA